MARGTGDRQKLLLYATVDEAPEYRAIIDVFVDAAESYRLPLKLEDIEHALHAAGAPVVLERDVLERRLEKLHHWGNLHRDRDESYATDLRAYERRAYLYDLSQAGEITHDVLVGLEDRLRRNVGLQRVALHRVRVLLGELTPHLRAEEPNGAEIFRLVEDLHHTFKALTANASQFLQKVNRVLNSVSVILAEYLLFKQDTIVYLTDFSDDLAGVTSEVRTLLIEMDAIDKSKVRAAWVAGAAGSGEREVDTREDTDSWADVADRHVSGVREWFRASEAEDTGVERLRRVLVRAVLGISQALARIHDAQQSPSGREEDLLAIARMFQEASTKDVAHQIAHAAFGLASARHFTEEADDDPNWRDRTWWQGPVKRQVVRLRAVSSGSKVGRAPNVRDHGASKRMLAERVHRENAALSAAARRLVGFGRIQLSALDVRIDGACLKLLVDLISTAQQRPMDSAGLRTGVSTDGRLRVAIHEPSGLTAAVVRSDLGLLVLPDYAIEITWTRQQGTNSVPEGGIAQRAAENSGRAW